MRTLLDTNLLISYLLSRQPSTSATGLILRAALAGRFTLLFTAGIADELGDKLTTRSDLAARVPRAHADELLLTLGAVAEVNPRLGEPYPEVGRDRKDDYLIAHAIAAGADYLVSWDKDLRDLGQVDGVRIVSPPEFLRILREAGRL